MFSRPSKFVLIFFISSLILNTTKFNAHIIDIKSDQSDQQDEIKSQKHKSVQKKKKLQTKYIIRNEILPKFELPQLILPKKDSLFSPAITNLKDAYDLPIDQSFIQYNQLLEAYPASREMIMRQMIAGPNVTFPKSPFADLEIERWSKNPKGLKLNEYAWLMKRNSISPYDPVHGFDRDKKLGLQFNYISLLLLFIKWIGDL